jgi:hypothetical protein
MVKCGVLFEVRTEFLYDIQTSFSFKGLNSVNQLIFLMVKCGVLFEVRTGFLYDIQTSFGCKGLNLNSVNYLIFVMVKCGVLFEVRTEFLNYIYMSFVFKGLIVQLGCPANRKYVKGIRTRMLELFKPRSAW